MKGLLAACSVLVLLMGDPITTAQNFVQTVSQPAQADQVQSENR